MDRDLYAYLPVILAVAERKSFTAAARQLRTAPSNVSHAVRRVEDRLGTPLFARSTRHVALTDAGLALIGQLAPATDDINRAWENVRSHKGKPSGHLRITIPRVAQPTLAPYVVEMAHRYPEVTVELFTDDGLSDVVSGGFDAGVRSGDIIAGDMVVVRLCPPFPMVTVASPDYVKRHGKPKTIGELEKHVLICYRHMTANRLCAWEFHVEGKDVEFETKGPVIVNDALQAVALAEKGVGIAISFEPAVRKSLAEGRLIRLLAQYSAQKPGLFLYFPKRASLAPKLRAFITVARDLAKNRQAG